MPIAGVPKGLRRQVKDVFVAALETNPLLANSRAIKTWITWDGNDSTTPPTTNQMPSCQIRFLAGPTRRLVTTRGPGQPMGHIDESRITVVIDLEVSGTDAGDLADVADLIYRALAPQDPSQRSALQQRFLTAGIKDWQLTREILPAEAGSYCLQSIQGQGSYDLTVQFFS